MSSPKSDMIVKTPTIIMPSEFTADEDRAFGRTHSLRDEWLQARLLAWFEREGGSRSWIAVLREGGKWHYWQQGEGMEPGADKRSYARTVVSYLNREVHFDGAWVGGWVDEGWKRFYLLWKDQDGDIHIPIDTPPELHWSKLRHWDADVWAEHAANAHQGWKAAQKAIDATPDQQMKLAQGQSKAHANPH